MLKYFLCWVLYKFGYTTNAIGGYRMKSAIQSFMTAQENLQSAIESEDKVLDKTRKRLEEQTRKLNAQIKEHEKIQSDSAKYLQNINRFLDISESDSADNDPHGDIPATDLADDPGPPTTS